jgi:V/A-type H+-transporting ATPase subunit K
MTMDSLYAVMGWTGIYAPVALGALGSAIGCTRAGKAAVGAVLEVDGGYGRYIGLSVLPSSIIIYGIVIMFTLNRPVKPEVAPGLFAVGGLVGIALLFIGALQGECCAAAINASKGKPSIFGLSITPAAIVEGLAVFAFVFALIVSGALPKG